MMVGRVIVDPVWIDEVGINVRGAANLGGAGSERVAERFVLTVGIGGKRRLSPLARVFTVGKDGAVCWTCNGTRIFIMALAVMACDARVSRKIGFADRGGVKGAGFMSDDCSCDVCNGGGGETRLDRA